MEFVDESIDPILCGLKAMIAGSYTWPDLCDEGSNISRKQSLMMSTFKLDEPSGQRIVGVQQRPRSPIWLHWL